MLFLDALNGLIDREPFGIGPDEQTLFGVDLHVLQQHPKVIGYFYVMLAFGRAHPLEEPFEEAIVRKNAVPFLLVPIRTPTFLTRLAHE